MMELSPSHPELLQVHVVAFVSEGYVNDVYASLDEANAEKAKADWIHEKAKCEKDAEMNAFCDGYEAFSFTVPIRRSEDLVNLIRFNPNHLGLDLG